MLTRAFWASRFQNFLGGAGGGRCPQTPLAARSFGAPNLPRLVLKSGYGPDSASWQCGRVFEWTLIELRFNIITNLFFFFWLFNGFSYNDVSSYKAFDTRDIFEYSCNRCSWTMKTNGTDKRLKLQERLLTISKRDTIRWNI